MLKKENPYHKRSGTDRRSGLERRKEDDPRFIDKIGFERRRYVRERRLPGEYRKGWARVNKWRSVLLGVRLTKKR